MRKSQVVRRNQKSPNLVWRSLNLDVKNISKSLSGLHLPLTVLVLALSFFGMLMIYSASAVVASDAGLSTFYYFLRQGLWIIIGLIAAFVVFKTPIEIIHKMAVPGMFVSIVLLVLVLAVGKEVNGATRWIDLGGFDLQPSEVAKLGFVVYLSAWLSRERARVKTLSEAIKFHFYTDLLPFMGLLAMVCGLIILQPDLDTAAIIAVMALVVYFVSGRDAIHSLGVTFVIVTTLAVGVGAAVIAPYRVARLNTYFNFLRSGDLTLDEKRGSGLQVWNGLIALGTGGLLGQGYGESRQKLYYLQYGAVFTDSIYAVIGEEFGLVGSFILILAFLLFMALGVGIALQAPDTFSALLAIGVSTWITLQAYLNIGAHLVIVPFGGIPLPFISYGGSNTIIIFVAVGLLLNVSRRSRGIGSRRG